MAAKVFISHSMQDFGMVELAKSLLEVKGLDAYVAVSEPEPGKRIDDKIIENIKSANYFIVLLTESSVASTWVLNEIGIAKSYHKKIIPIVEEGTEIPPIIRDIEYVTIDNKDPSKCLNFVSEYLEIDLSKSDKNWLIAAILILLGIVLLAALFSD